MTVGTWRSPLPFRVGGSGHRNISDVYQTIRTNIGQALLTEDGSTNSIENRSFARAIALLDNDSERRARSADARKLPPQLLERWEGILGLNSSGSVRDRRATVSARTRASFSSLNGALSRIAEESFDPWFTRMQYVSKADAVMYWPGGTTLVGYPWYSTVAIIIVEYHRPVGASQEDVDTRRSACASSLDEFAPAWCTFSMSETQLCGPNAEQVGFFCDQPNLDVAVLIPE